MFYAHLLGRALEEYSSSANREIKLHPGQILYGKVVKTLPDYHALIQIAGTSFYANVMAELQIGQRILLQVLPQRNPITLKIIDPKVIGRSNRKNNNADNSSHQGIDVRL